MGGCRRDTEPSSGFADGEPANRRQALLWDIDEWSPEPLPLGLHPRQARPHPLLDATALELGDSREDMQLQPACGRRRVDSLRQADERHAERLELVEQENQVAQVATCLLYTSPSPRDS